MYNQQTFMIFFYIECYIALKFYQPTFTGTKTLWLMSLLTVTRNTYRLAAIQRGFSESIQSLVVLYL